MVVSIFSMLYIYFFTKIAWTWYVFIGSTITVFSAWLASLLFAPAPVTKRDELAPRRTAETQ